MKMLRNTSSFVKLEHSLFSLPLLFAGALLFLGSPRQASIPWGKFALIVLAGTGARTAALALNRVIDRKLDALNPRTAGRELPAGKMTLGQAWAIVAIGAALYLIAAAALGPLCLKLSPIPLAVFVAYPLMKRFTPAAHFGVGLGLALAPLGGYVGLAGALPTHPGAWFLAGFTFAWVSGFDILYATMDEDFDRKAGLNSIPARFGKATAQDVALVLHGLAFFCLASMRWNSFSAKGPLIWLALVPAAALLLAEQRSGYSLDANSPFFKINAWIGVAVLVWVLAGLW